MRRGLLLVLVLAGAACAEPADPIEIGAIHFYSDPPQIEAPTAAAMGERFEVRVRTYALACEYLAYTDRDLWPDGASITPYNANSSPDSCILILVYIDHTATLWFDTPGPKTVLIRGRHVGGSLDEVIEVPITVAITDR